MARVISSENLQSHSVNKYTFKVLSASLNNNSDDVSEEEPPPPDNSPELQSNDVDSSSLGNSSKESLIESLMQKTDEMSSNFIKLQMKLESMTEEHKKELEKTKELSFNEGLIAGKEELLKDGEKDIANGLAHFTASVATLEKSASEYEKALEGIKSELIGAALDIAKEVVRVELDSSSTQIAQVLSNELIKELQGASKVTLKVNPKNHGEISESLGSLEHIEVISDSAVSEGGVIAISDAGNIDAQISKRFQRVKRAALNE